MSTTTWIPSFSPGRAILLVAVLACLALAFAARGWQKSPLSKLPCPPGPPPKSLISGNLSDLPAERPWLRYTGWSRKYGTFHPPFNQISDTQSLFTQAISFSFACLVKELSSSTLSMLRLNSSKSAPTSTRIGLRLQ